MEVLWVLVVPAAAIVIFLGTIVYIVLRVVLSARRRSADLRRVAAEMGLEFGNGGKEAFLARIHGFPGASKTSGNVIIGKTGTLDVAIGDYHRGSGKNSSIQTSIFLCGHGLSFPEFVLRPEGLAEKLSAWVGHRDINFESHASFSNVYHLTGRDEEQIRTVFTSKVLDFFEQKPGLSIESFDDTLMLYRQDVKVHPDRLHTLIEEGFAVLSQFHPPA